MKMQCLRLSPLVTVLLAANVSSVRGGGNPACGAAATHDCFTIGGPGCTDEKCCNMVCAVDPFCCEVAWDVLCVNDAAATCKIIAPSNDSCVDRIVIGIGDTPFTTVGATTDGPPPTCIDVAGDPQINQDVWYSFFAGTSKPYTASLCDSGYDTKMAVYNGCACPADTATEIACNDDFCGLRSRVSWDATAGNCYTIRVGGVQSAMGAGTLHVQEGIPPGPCDDPKNHPCNVGGGPGCSDHDCCTTVCRIDPFCCDVAWDRICVGEAAQFCGPCFSCVNCPPDSVQEAEPCGTNSNGGCDSTPPAFEKISLIQVTCGTAWTDGVQRDTDWYQFTVTVDDTYVYWSLLSDYPMMACIMNNDCGNLQVIAQGSGNFPVVAEAKLPAGTYVGFVADVLFGHNPCGTRNTDYVVFLYGVLPCPADATGEGLVNTGDLLVVINNWGCQSACNGDLNDDGIVNAGDLLLVINNWGPCP